MLAFALLAGACCAQAQNNSSDVVTEQTISEANAGDAASQYALGAFYIFGGLGVPQDFGKAVAWLSKSADQGNADAEFALGALYGAAAGPVYAASHGALHDDAKSAFWYRMSADQGNADAQVALGVRYDVALGVPQDYVKAAYWYRKSGDQGNADALAHLGQLYADGNGVVQNYRKAVSLCRRAADQNSFYGQVCLGALYARAQDMRGAYFWLDLAVTNGLPELHDISVETRDLVAKDLTEAQLSAVKDQERRWLISHPSSRK